ncbi:hypothetical protein [Desulfonatronospira sp.]|nr:hypothetical protein [Desulfonatronospira sp.]
MLYKEEVYMIIRAAMDILPLKLGLPGLPRILSSSIPGQAGQANQHE